MIYKLFEPNFPQLEGVIYIVGIVGIVGSVRPQLAAMTPANSLKTPMMEASGVQGPRCWPIASTEPGPIASTEPDASQTNIVIDVHGIEPLPMAPPETRMANIYPPEPPGGAWSSDLCDCFSDCRTCCAVTFCECITVAQLAQRFYPNKYRCKIVAVILFTLSCGSVVTGQISSAITRERIAEIVSFLYSCHHDEMCVDKGGKMVPPDHRPMVLGGTRTDSSNQTRICTP